MASALSAPLAISKTRLACIMACIPMEYACRGTCASFSKKRVLAAMVLSVRVT